jgi:chromosome segregation ATPase
MASRRGAAVPRAATSVRALGVVLEQMHSQMGVVVEAVTSMQAKLDKKLDAEEAIRRFEIIEDVVRQNSADIRRLEARVSALEEAVRRNSEDIKKNSEDIKKNSEDIRELREQVAGLRHDFDHRSELTRISDLEGRVAELERRVAER